MSVSPSPSPSIVYEAPPEPSMYNDQRIVQGTIDRKDVTGILAKNIKIPSWNTPGRPKKSKPGTVGFNLQTNSLEFWNGSFWLKLPMKKIN